MRVSLNITLLAVLTALSPIAQAGPAEDALIAKVVDGYGGAKLQELQSIQIQGDIRISNPGQGYTSDFVGDLNRSAQH